MLSQQTANENAGDGLIPAMSRVISADNGDKSHARAPPNTDIDLQLKSWDLSRVFTGR